MNLFDKYLSYWPVIAASLVFFILGLWWQLSAARAMELTPKPASWVKRYRSGGFPFRKELLGSPKLRWWVLLLAALAGAAFALGRLANVGTIYLNQPGLFLQSKYGLFLILLCGVGACAVGWLLTVLFESPWVSLPGTLLFAASAARGHGESCFLAVSLLLLVLYLRAEKPGFPAELLYLGAILVLGPVLALRQAMAWLLLCFPPVHWYKLISQRRAGRLTGGQLAAALLAALAGWALAVVLGALLRRYLMFGFRTRELLELLNLTRIRYACSELLLCIRQSLFTAPTPGMTIDLMVDAPLLGFGLWGCRSAWTLGTKRRDARGVLALAVLAALLLVWLITGKYAVTLGLVLTASCILRDANIGKKRLGVILLTLAGILWYVGIQIAAWYVPLVPGLIERLV